MFRFLRRVYREESSLEATKIVYEIMNQLDSVGVSDG